MTFIPKPERPKVIGIQNSFKTLRPAFRERQYGSEFNQWEFRLLKEFSDSKKSSNPRVSGSVVFNGALGRDHFLLIPASHLPQDYVICRCPANIPVPANLSYVTVTGKRSVFYDHWEILVEDISYERLKIPIKPEIDFREFQDQLFLKWGGIDTPLRELLAFEFVSSPPMLDLGQIGGLNITVYDGTGRKESKKLLNYFRDMLPLDIALGKSGNLALPELSINQQLSPFSWRFRCFDADKPLNQRLTNFLDCRQSKRFPEISIGLGSKRGQPKSIYDQPLTMVDQPTLLPNSAEMLKMHFDPPLEVTKYVITMQMLFPSIGKTHIDLDTTLENASKKVVNIAEKYGVPQTVQEHGLFDPSYYGKPQSVLRLALASARAGEEQTINNEYVMKVFDEFYLKNVEGIMETWEDIFNRKGIEIVSLNEFDRMIMKFITAEESNDFGVGFNILAEHFVNSRTDEVALWRSLEDLKRKGKICEPKHDVYRSLPFE